MLKLGCKCRVALQRWINEDHTKGRRSRCGHIDSPPSRESIEPVGAIRFAATGPVRDKISRAGAERSIEHMRALRTSVPHEGLTGRRNVHSGLSGRAEHADPWDHPHNVSSRFHRQCCFFPSIKEESIYE
jgi:hypothetical protein